MAKKEDEVIIIKGDAVVRVSASAFRQVMLAAGQMKDDWFDYAGRRVRLRPDSMRCGSCLRW
jgi:hypothetical protein